MTVSRISKLFQAVTKCTALFSVTTFKRCALKSGNFSELLKRYRTTLIALCEAKGQHDTKVISNLQRFAPGYTLMNGQESNTGGVCLLVRTSLIDSHCSVQFFNKNSAEKPTEIV